jgi:hypothetical protein
VGNRRSRGRVFLPALVLAVSGTYFSLSPVALTSKGQPEDALRRLQRDEAGGRRLARMWPSQFRDVLAYTLISKSDALHALHRYGHALHCADEGVAIYQALTPENPAKYSPYLSHSIDTQSRALAGLGRQAEAIQAIDTSITMFRHTLAALWDGSSTTSLRHPSHSATHRRPACFPS